MLKPVVLVTLLLGQISLELLQAALCDIARCRALGGIDPRLADGDDELDELVQLRDRELMVLVWVEMPDVVREPRTCVRESSRSGHEPREQDVQRCFHARHSRARARGASAGEGLQGPKRSRSEAARRRRANRFQVKYVLKNLRIFGMKLTGHLVQVTFTNGNVEYVI